MKYWGSNRKFVSRDVHKFALLYVILNTVFYIYSLLSILLLVGVLQQCGHKANAKNLFELLAFCWPLPGL